jgi:hypothetical protein
VCPVCVCVCVCPVCVCVCDEEYVRCLAALSAGLVLLVDRRLQGLCYKPLLAVAPPSEYIHLISI